jgi:uncharacterized phage protein (TIGR02216 family)
MAGERVAWGRLMRFGLGRLGLRPEEFWALTPAEFLVMAGAEGGSGRLSRAGLAALMARFPDEPKDGGGAIGRP